MPQKSSLRFRVTFFLLFPFASAATHAVEPDPIPPDSSTANLSADEIKALIGSSWIHSETARASLGWRDNILLSSYAPIAREFFRGELEVFLWRAGAGRWDFVSFLNGDVLRYFSPPPETGGEQQWFLHGEFRQKPSSALQLSLKGDVFFQDLVIDLSETEAERVVAPTRAVGAFVTAAARYTLPRGFAVEPSLQIKRTDYRDYAGDYDEARGGATLEWKQTDKLVLSAGWSERQRRYLQRNEYTAGGRLLPDTRLRFEQQEAEMKASTTLTGSGTWTFALSGSRLENRDSGSGFFDYNQKRGRVEAEWKRGAWRISFDGEARRLDFLIQTVGSGISPPARKTEAFETTLHAERELNIAWKIFAEHRWERDRSNEPGFSYRAQTLLGGIQRTF